MYWEVFSRFVVMGKIDVKSQLCTNLFQVDTKTTFDAFFYLH